jgi:predicted nuclease of predicted toxin-antitoxin system
MEKQHEDQVRDARQAEPVLDVGLAKSKDNPVWHYAAQHGAAIVTKDEDFAEWVRRGRPGPSVVWLRIGNSSKRVLLTWFDPLLPLIVRKLQQGERLIEVR